MCSLQANTLLIELFSARQQAGSGARQATASNEKDIRRSRLFLFSCRC